MPYTRARADWQDLPSRATPVRASDLEHIEDGIVAVTAMVEAGGGGGTGLTEEQVDVIETAARVVGGVLVDPAGDPIDVGSGTGEVTPEDVADAIDAATTPFDFPAGSTVGGADPIEVVVAVDGSTAALKVTIGGVAGLLPLTVGTFVPDGDGGIDPGDSPWRDRIVYEWASPYTSPASMAATVGATALTNSDSGGTQAYQISQVLNTDNSGDPVTGGAAGNFKIGFLSVLYATLPTPVPLKPGLGATVIAARFKRLATLNDNTSAPMMSFSTSGDQGVHVEITQDGAGGTGVRYWRDDGAADTTHLVSPNYPGTIAYHGTGGPFNGIAANWADDWHVISLVCKPAGARVYIDGADVWGTDLTTPDADMSLIRWGLYTGTSGGYELDDPFIATAMTDAEITDMTTELMA